jgi:hypothetical protein
MNRRSFLGSLTLATTVGTAGCLSGGGEVVVETQRDVEVVADSGWKTEIPDVSDKGGTISYIARADTPFDVYFFTDEASYTEYRAYIRNDRHEASAAGNQDVGTTATPDGDDFYQASTPDDGARYEIEETGPYLFVLDHSDYPPGGGAYPSEHASPLTVRLNLTVTRDNFGL